MKCNISHNLEHEPRAQPHIIHTEHDVYAMLESLLGGFKKHIYTNIHSNFNLPIAKYEMMKSDPRIFVSFSGVWKYETQLNIYSNFKIGYRPNL